jgi:GDP-4-dehydro-6-deoxy-D-mannose reductase
VADGAGQAALVLGLGGFMGSAVAQAATESGYRVTGLDAVTTDAWEDVRVVDLTAPDAVQSVDGVLRDVEPQLVVNCAGLTPRGPATSARDMMYAVNTLGVARLLTAVSAAATDARVIHLSTAAVYGRDLGSRVGEDSPLDAEGHYAGSKLMGDIVCETFAETDGVDVVIARPFNVLGPGEPAGSIVSDLATQVLPVPPGQTATVSLREVASPRDFIDVRDVAEALILLADKGTTGAAYNVCTGISTSVSDLVSAAATAWDREIVVEPEQPDASGTHSVGDPGRLMSLGWSPARDLSTSLADIASELGRT